MNNKVIMIVGIFVFIIGIGVVIYLSVRNNGDDNNNDTPKEKDPKILELTYDINAGIPFKWEFEIADESVVEYVKSYQVSNDNKDGRSGGRIVTNYVFKGLKEGETTITFKFVSITNEMEPTLEVNHVKVDNDLNITLVKNGD